MRIGLMVNGPGIDDVKREVEDAVKAGFASVYMSQIFGLDALTTLAVVGREVPGNIELGTAVIPTYPRHPIVLAQQAMTAQAASGGRLVLGIGLSHQMVIEGMYGFSFDKPAIHMREYLSALLPLVRNEQVQFEGKTLKAATMGPLTIPGSTPMPVLLAALAPRMLKLAGAVADGTVTWMTGPATIADHIVPLITAAAEKAGRPAPRISVGLPVCVTDDPDSARERAAKLFQIYGMLPSYRAMLDKEGAAGPADVAIVGDEGTVSKQISALSDAGATEFVGAVFGEGAERDRTTAVLKDLV
jgi:F420-dependent oxidoreductase-like protein